MMWKPSTRPPQPALVTEFEEYAQEDNVALLVGTLGLRKEGKLEIVAVEEVFVQTILVGWRITGRLHRGRGHRILEVVYFSSLLGQIVREKPTRDIIHEAVIHYEEQALLWARYDLVVHQRCSVEEALNLQLGLTVRDGTGPDSQVIGWTITTFGQVLPAKRQEYFVSPAGLVTRKA